MPQKIVDFYNVTPKDLQPGDVFVVAVTCHVQAIDEEGNIYISTYRCPYPLDVIPQGTQWDNEVSKSLFPVLKFGFKDILSI